MDLGVWRDYLSSPNSSGIIGEKLRAGLLGKGGYKNYLITGIQQLWPEKLFWRKTPSPHFLFFYFNERLDFCEFFE